jgi:hypothetical protein
MGWTIGVRRVRFPEGLEIFLFSIASRPTLRPTQPPTQWVWGAVSPGVNPGGKWLGLEADHSPHSSAGIKECVELYLHPPKVLMARRLFKSTATTLPVTLANWTSFRFLSRTLFHGINSVINSLRRSQWPRGLRHALFLAARTLGSQVRILFGALMCVRVFSVFCCPV